jgi:hypothetical protein
MDFLFHVPFFCTVYVQNCLTHLDVIFLIGAHCSILTVHKTLRYNMIYFKQ